MRRAYCTNVMCEKRINFKTKQQRQTEKKQEKEKEKKEEEKEEEKEQREEETYYWDTIEDGGVPMCKECGSVLRPDVVLFGEVMKYSLSLYLYSLFLSLSFSLSLTLSLYIYKYI